MNATETVRQFLRKNGHICEEVNEGYGRYRSRPCSLNLTLVDFGAEGNFLRLIEQEDGRIDLIDANCSDTGCDFSEESLSSLQRQASEWAAIMLGMCSTEERSEMAPDIRQQIAMIAS